ncbi:MAG: hypothetical protein WB735_15085, partial [Pseudonocardiaceae bacterium]
DAAIERLLMRIRNVEEPAKIGPERVEAVAVLRLDLLVEEALAPADKALQLQLDVVTPAIQIRKYDGIHVPVVGSTEHGMGEDFGGSTEAPDAALRARPQLGKECRRSMPLEARRS